MMHPTDYKANNIDPAPTAFVERGEFSEELRKAMMSISALTLSPLSGRLANLKAMIGDELYNALGDEDRLFMAETAGVVDFGHPVDLGVVARDIEEYGDTE